MERARRGDDNGVDIRVVDCSIEIGIDLDSTARDLGALFCAFFKYITHRHDLRAADTVLDTFNVLAANHAAADNSNVQFHEKFLL